MMKTISVYVKGCMYVGRLCRWERGWSTGEYSTVMTLAHEKSTPRVKFSPERCNLFFLEVDRLYSFINSVNYVYWIIITLLHTLHIYLRPSAEVQ